MFPLAGALIATIRFPSALRSSSIRVIATRFARTRSAKARNVPMECSSFAASSRNCSPTRGVTKWYPG